MQLEHSPQSSSSRLRFILPPASGHPGKIREPRRGDVNVLLQYLSQVLELHRSNLICECSWMTASREWGLGKWGSDAGLGTESRLTLLATLATELRII